MIDKEKTCVPPLRKKIVMDNILHLLRGCVKSAQNSVSIKKIIIWQKIGLLLFLWMNIYCSLFKNIIFKTRKPTIW